MGHSSSRCCHPAVKTTHFNSRTMPCYPMPQPPSDSQQLNKKWASQTRQPLSSKTGSSCKRRKRTWTRGWRSSRASASPWNRLALRRSSWLRNVSNWKGRFRVWRRWRTSCFWRYKGWRCLCRRRPHSLRRRYRLRELMGQRWTQELHRWSYKWRNCKNWAWKRRELTKRTCWR